MCITYICNLKVDTVMISLWIMKGSIKMRSFGHDNAHFRSQIPELRLSITILNSESSRNTAS